MSTTVDAQTAKNAIGIIGAIMKTYPGNSASGVRAVEKRKLKTMDKSGKKSRNPVLEAILEAAMKLKEASTCQKCARTNQCRTDAEEELKAVHQSAEELTRKLLETEEELEENQQVIEDLLREQEAEAALEAELEALKIRINQLVKKNEELKEKNTELKASL